MKNSRVFALILSLCLIFAAFCPAVLADCAPDITAKNAIVIDMNTGTVLYEKDADSKAAPASTTKIMTLLLICEAVERGDVKLDDIVSATKSDITLNDEDATSVKLKPGEELSLHDLCCCAMLVSANDACNVAASYVSGSVDEFVALMNERAAELGCENTHFVNTNGLPSGEHYTTARELAIIAREALKHEFFRELCGMTEYTVPKTSVSSERKLSSSNALINSKACYGDQYLYEGAYGVKTGHTDAAGFCLVSAVKVDSFDLLTVVLGSNGDSVKGKYFNNFGDTISLLDYCRNNWIDTVILSTEDIVAEMPVEKGVEDSVSLSPASDISRLMPIDYDLSSLIRDVKLDSDRITAPVRAGTVLGQVSLSTAEGDALCSVELVAASDVSPSIKDYVMDGIQDLVRNNISYISYIGIIVLLLIIAVFLAIYIPHKKKAKKKKGKKKK